MIKVMGVVRLIALLPIMPRPANRHGGMPEATVYSTHGSLAPPEGEFRRMGRESGRGELVAAGVPAGRCTHYHLPGNTAWEDAVLCNDHRNRRHVDQHGPRSSWGAHVDTSLVLQDDLAVLGVLLEDRFERFDHRRVARVIRRGHVGGRQRSTPKGFPIAPL